MSQFSSYAPPMTWGPWAQIASHFGSVRYTISYEPVGDANVVARIRYYKEGTSHEVIEEFKDETVIVTSNSIAVVEVSFKGLLTGSAVTGSVSP
ncbi:MAG: hypothetical protein JNM83_16135 [Myxococcales bacterium]|nr:hypothetical protein [Myxococcales bacterium]